MGGWLALLGAIIGFAWLGDGGSASSTPHGATIALASNAPSPSARSTDATASARAIQLDEPPRSGAVVTTRELIVRGRVAADAGEVRIMLESSNGKPIAMAAIDPTGHPRGGLVPFEARFELSKPRPGGTMMLFVIVVDRNGLPIDGFRRRFVVGAVVEVPATSTPPAG